MPTDEERAEVVYKASDAALRLQEYFDPSTAWEPAGVRAWKAAVIATRDRLDSEVQEFSDIAADDELPHWPSTIRVIDRDYCGFHGLTSIVAPPKVGKTLLSWASALQTAATMQWNVFYFGGELDMAEMQRRRAREFAAHPGALDGVDFLTMIHVGLGQRPVDFCVDMAAAGYDPELPILVCIDSINSVATLSRRDYLRTIEEFGLWAMMARRISRGAISFLIVSETNKSGKSKGEKLEFWSDFAIQMKGKTDELAVDVAVTQTRQHRYAPVPMLCRCVANNRFLDKEQLMDVAQPALRLVE